MHGSFFTSLVPLMIMVIPIVFICRRLAKEKSKDVALWTVLGVIPGVNYFVLLYLVGAPNTGLEEKIDKVLSLLQKQQ